MKVLFIGGTGIISSACSQLAVNKNITLYHFNRGQTDRMVPPEIHVFHGDIRNPADLKELLKDHTFDVVVNWVAYVPDHIQSDISLFRGRTGQYIFISSASVYQTPPHTLPVTESTPLDNPFWQYSRDKIACEKMLFEAFDRDNFPVTIVRPSHTYDERTLPFTAGYTVVDRMRKGKPVIVHGDGTSIWTLTHHKDFAKGFVGLLGNSGAIGEAFHITSDEILTWNQIFYIIAEAADVISPELLYVPSKTIAQFDKNWGAGLLGDKSHSMIFANDKIKQVVPDFRAEIPFSQGAREIMTWYDADTSRQNTDHRFNTLYDRISQVFHELQVT